MAWSCGSSWFGGDNIPRQGSLLLYGLQSQGLPISAAAVVWSYILGQSDNRILQSVGCGLNLLAAPPVYIRLAWCTGEWYQVHGVRMPIVCARTRARGCPDELVACQQKSRVCLAACKGPVYQQSHKKLILLQAVQPPSWFTRNKHGRWSAASSVCQSLPGVRSELCSAAQLY
jgi:hypothetical protein